MMTHRIGTRSARVGNTLVPEMSDDHPRTVALVPGTAHGVGLGIAQALAAAGLKVALTDIDGAGVARSAAELARRDQGAETLGLTLDVTRSTDWSRVVTEVLDRWGG